MKLSKLITLLLAFLLILNSTLTLSQAQNKPPDRMKMLAAFNGEWKGEMVKIIDSKTVRYKLAHTSEKVAGGWGVQLNEKANIPDKGNYLATRIFSYSSASDSTFMYTIDNFGETWFFTGTWESTKKLVLISRMELHGKLTEKVIIYQFLNTREYNFKSITRVAGSPDEFVEMIMKRE